MKKYTPEKILELIEENDVRFLRLQFINIFGELKNLALTGSQISRALSGKFVFDGDCVEGFENPESGDLFLYPDLDTFAVFPWRPQSGRVARLICDVHDAGKRPLEGYSRSVLRRAQAQALSMGYEVGMGAECEFFLFHRDDKDRPTVFTHDKPGYMCTAPYDTGENVRRDICLTLEELGYDVESSHHELSTGQHEVEICPSAPLDAADKIVTLRMAVGVIAQRHGLHASYMPKPFADQPGSGMHVTIKLMKDGKNAFHDLSKPDELSDTALSFIAGMMEYMDDMTAVLNPTVNSYKRLMPGVGAPPVCNTWGLYSHRPLIRVPAFTNGEEISIEVRSPDMTSNPYFVYAMLISAGLDGINKGIMPPAQYTGLVSDECCPTGQRILPRDLKDAIDRMTSGTFASHVLGEEQVEYFAAAKLTEWSEYCRAIHNWEIERYL